MTSCTCNRTVVWRLWLPVHATRLSFDGCDFLYMQEDCQLTVMTSCTRVHSKTVRKCKPTHFWYWAVQMQEPLSDYSSTSLIIPRLFSYFCSWVSIACYKRSNKGVTETARLQWKSAAQYYFTNFAPGGSKESYELSLLPATPPACLLMTSP